MVLPYLKGLINKVNHFYLYSDFVISWVYLHFLIFSYQGYNIHPVANPHPEAHPQELIAPHLYASVAPSQTNTSWLSPPEIL